MCLLQEIQLESIAVGFRPHTNSVKRAQSAAVGGMRESRYQSILFAADSLDQVVDSLLYRVAKSCKISAGPQLLSTPLSLGSPSNTRYSHTHSSSTVPSQTRSLIDGKRCLWHRRDFSLDVFGFEILGVFKKYIVYLVKQLKHIHQSCAEMKVIS